MDDIMNTPSPFAQTQVPKEFEKLRHMDQFSEAMFNRIVGFQEREHAAWDSGAPFAERIKDLPLHALIFSNPDRDPAKFAATVAPFYPLRGEMQQIAHCIKQVTENPVVCDLHAGNGFVGSLIAREGLKVVGLRDPQQKPNQIKNFYDADCYQMRESDDGVDLSSVGFDVALSVWMPSGKNLTPAIVAARPKLIVFIHTDHVDTSSDQPQTGTPEAYTDLPENYKCIAEWSITRPEDLLHEVWPDLTPSIEEIRQVKIFADTPFHDIDVGTELVAEEPYSWEHDQDMALTAYQAKMQLREQGYPV